jgi:hypothetical protein
MLARCVVSRLRERIRQKHAIRLPILTARRYRARYQIGDSMIDNFAPKRATGDVPEPAPAQ